MDHGCWGLSFKLNSQSDIALSADAASSEAQKTPKTTQNIHLPVASGSGAGGGDAATNIPVQFVDPSEGRTLVHRGYEPSENETEIATKADHKCEFSSVYGTFRLDPGSTYSKYDIRNDTPIHVLFIRREVTLRLTISPPTTYGEFYKLENYGDFMHVSNAWAGYFKVKQLCDCTENADFFYKIPVDVLPVKKQ